MTEPAWKVFERRVARFLGAERNPLSGRNAKHSASDSLHPTLYIESKYFKDYSIITNWYEAKKHAKKEGKPPLIIIEIKKHSMMWLLVHSSNLLEVAEAVKPGLPEIISSLYIEIKCRKRFAIITEWYRAKELAEKEDKIPVVAIGIKKKRGFWLLAKELHLLKVADAVRTKQK